MVAAEVGDVVETGVGNGFGLGVGDGVGGAGVGDFATKQRKAQNKKTKITST
jgi:hypothetical protein